jgi:hypothetical protein
MCSYGGSNFYRSGLKGTISEVSVFRYEELESRKYFGIVDIIQILFLQLCFNKNQ